MIELTGIGALLRGVGVLYVLVAVACVGLAVYLPKGWRRKVAFASVALALFGIVPAMQWIEEREREAYAKAAWAHFKKLCAEKSGEKIYKTYTGVKSVLVIKPLPPATEKDLYDQHWYGDPYSNDSAHEDRGERAAALLIGRVEFSKYAHAQHGFDFIEQHVGKQGESAFQRIHPLKSPPFATKVAIAKPDSRFGISWEDISTPEDRKYWVAGSRLRILDLTDNKIVAERVGFFIEAGFGSSAGQRRPWQSSRGPNTTCPPIANRDFSDRWFILKVLNPIEEKRDGK
jgi:hypothetical protein